MPPLIRPVARSIPRLPVLSLLLVASLAALWLAACGGSDAEGREPAAGHADATATTATHVHAMPSPTSPTTLAPPAATSTAPEEATAMPSPTGTEAETASVATTATEAAPPATEPSDEAVVVRIIDFAFDPPLLEIAAGTTVTFINEGVDHTATSRTGELAFDTGILQTGEQATVTFASAGTFDYWCLLHPDMVGTIVVR